MGSQVFLLSISSVIVAFLYTAVFVFEIDICDHQRKGKIKEEQVGWETEERPK